MSPRMSEKELLSNIAELPREISPARDPWPGIAAAIEKLPARADSAKPAANWWLRAAAASVVLAFTAGLVLKSPFGENTPSPEVLVSSEPESATLEAVEFVSSDVPGLLSTVDAEYLAAFREFISAEDSHNSLAPQTIEKIEMGWADLRVTEEALAVALEQNPGDLFLNERMLELRSRQLGFLKQLVSLDRNNRRLTI